MSGRLTRLSRRVTLGRLTHSDTARRRGLKNTPRFSDLRRLKKLALLLDRVERALGHAVEVTSGYRNPELNRLVGGAPRSQHLRGQAADLRCARFGDSLSMARAIARAGIDFDQLIHEFGCSPGGGWVHISWAPKPRRRMLTICSMQRGYRVGLHPCHCGSD